MEIINKIVSRIYNSNLKVFIILALLVFGTYFQSLSFEFVALDDYDLIVNKQHILRDLKNLPLLFKTNLFMSESGVYYRPFVMISFMIDALIGGKNPFIYHFSNIFYHLIASFLLFIFLKNLINDRLKSFLFSLIFSVHPALSQAIVWIPGRNDSLLLIFLILSFILLIKSQNTSQEKRLLFRVISLVSFFFALLTKENAALILLFILFYLILLNEKEIDYKKVIRTFLVYLVPLLIYLLTRSIADVESPLSENLVLTPVDYIKGLINYFGKIFIPVNLSVLTFPENINPVYGIISLSIFIALSISGIHNLKLYVFGILWFLFFLLSGMIGLTGFTNFLDHRLYVPIVGIFISLIQLKFFDLIKSEIIIAALSIYIVALFYLNINHTKNFNDPLTFYKSAVETAPQSFFTHRGLANVYHRLSKYELAEKHYRKSIELNSSSAETYLNFGINFKKEGLIDSAEFYFLKAIKLNPQLESAYNNLGNLYLQKNLFDKSEFYLRQAIRLNPRYFETYNNLGVLYAKTGNDAQAYKYFKRSIEINPFFAEGYFNLAIYFFNKNQLDSSYYFYQKAIQNGFPERNILSDKWKR